MMTKKVAFLFGLASATSLMGCGEDDTGASSTGIGTFTTDTGDSGVTESMTADGGEAGTMDGSTGSGDAGDGDSGTDTNASGGDGDSGSTSDTSGGDGDSGSTGSTSGGDGDSGSTSGGDGDSGTTSDTSGGDGDSGSTSGDGDSGSSGGDGDSGTTTGGTSTTGGSGTTGATDCQAPSTYADCDGTPGALTTDPFQAIGLNCPGNASNTIAASNTSMNSNNNNAWRIATGFGTAAGNNYGNLLWAANQDPWTSPGGEDIDPNTSSAILILSTGVVAGTNGQGVVVESASSQGGNGDNTNDDSNTLPPPLSAQRGSENGAGGNPFNNCDGVNDCSDSLYDQWYNQGWNDPNDKLWMSFDVEVPAGTFGYVFDFAYFSSEWPSWINTVYNDLFIAWQVSEVYTGNVTFVNDAPLTITSLDAAGAFQYTNSAPELAGTGFEGNAGTGWFTARGAVNENETASITYFIADMGDSILATGVLLDNFRWECEGCVPSEIDDCGLTPLPE